MGRQTQPSGREDPLDVHDCSGAHQTQKALSGLEGCARNQRITRGIGKFHVSIKVWKTTRHALATFHPPSTYRFRVAQGVYRNAQNQRVSCTPAIKGGSTSQHMSHSVIRLACSLAVLCGGSLRPLALLWSALFLIPMTKASSNRWMDDMGTPLPTPDARLRQLLALAPATA